MGIYKQVEENNFGNNKGISMNGMLDKIKSFMVIDRKIAPIATLGYVVYLIGNYWN